VANVPALTKFSVELQNGEMVKFEFLNSAFTDLTFTEPNPSQGSVLYDGIADERIDNANLFNEKTNEMLQEKTVITNLIASHGLDEQSGIQFENFIGEMLIVAEALFKGDNVA
jgi:hypothetical protein